MSRIRKYILALFVSLADVVCGAPGWAVPTIYTDEATYLADLANMGYVPATDSFEDDNFWGLLEPTATTTVPDVTSQAITWTGLGGGLNLLSSGAKTGDWVLQSSPPDSPSDGFLATAEEPLFGFGGWLKAGNAGTSGQNDISAFLNGSAVAVDIFGVPKTPYTFWGVIDPAGIASVQFETEPVQLPDPGSGDPIDPSKTIFLDDFTFGFATAPSLREPGTNWTNSAGGTYATGTNWNGASAPATTDNALFHLGSAAPYTVNFSQNETASQAVIGNDKVNFDLAGFQYNLTEANITRESLIVGERPGDVGELTVTNGTIAGVNTVVAHSSTSTGHLTLGAGSSVNLSGVMRVGSSGTGALDINSGATLTNSGGSSGPTTGWSFIGQLGGNGTVNLDGPGSQWSLTGTYGTVFLGAGGGTGTLNISNGASGTFGAMYAGVLADNGLPTDIAGSGAISVDGAQTSLTVASFILGKEGLATLDVTTGASVAASSLVVAQGGNASMNLSGGATVTGNTGTIGVSADGNVVVDGPGTDWTAITSLTIGAGNQIGSFITFPPPPIHTGTLTIQNGGSVSSSNGSSIGDTRTGRGVLTVTGLGSSFTSGGQFSGDTFVGFLGDGELNVLAGATIDTGRVFVGRFGVRDRLKGVVNVDGTGSTWNTHSSSSIFVGFNNDPQSFFGAGAFFAEGNLNITNGGTVNAGYLALADRKISKGVVSISGPGSLISVTSAHLGSISTNSFTFTFGSNAELNVSNSGLLDVTGDLDVYHGTINLDQGTINAANLNMYGKLLTAGSNTFDTTGDTAVILAGSGQVNSNVDNIGGIVTPGQSAGILNIAGNYTQHTNLGGGFEHNASLAIELGGTDNSDPLNPQFDQLLISGLATLGGTLDVSLIDLGSGPFVPQIGDSFDILSATGGLVGTFDTLILPALSSGLQWQLNPSGNTLFLNVTSLLTADFDSDGDVDGNDLTDPTLGWEARFGVDLNGADFLAWQQQFGSNTAPLAASVAVPEPNSFRLLLLGIFSLLFMERDRMIQTARKFFGG